MKNDRDNLAYLACPFSHPNSDVQQIRHRFVNLVAFEFHKKGKLIYSPLTHNVPLSHLSNEANSWNTWERFDQAMLMRCDELMVLALPGWENSRGVSAEINLAKQLNLPITIIDPRKDFGLDMTALYELFQQ